MPYFCEDRSTVRTTSPTVRQPTMPAIPTTTLINVLGMKKMMELLHITTSQGRSGRGGNGVDIYRPDALEPLQPSKGFD